MMILSLTEYLKANGPTVGILAVCHDAHGNESRFSVLMSEKESLIAPTPEQQPENGGAALAKTVITALRYNPVLAEELFAILQDPIKDLIVNTEAEYPTKDEVTAFVENMIDNLEVNIDAEARLETNSFRNPSW